MKNVIVTLTALSFISFSLGLHSCCKDNGPNTDTTTKPPPDPCTFNTKLSNYSYGFADTGAISTSILTFANFIPQGTAVDSIQGNTVASTVVADLTAQGIKECQVQNIRAQNLRVKIDSPASYNFDVMDSIWLYIIKKDGTGKTVIASKGGIPAGAKEIIMNITPNLDVAPYVMQDSFKFQLGARRGSLPVSYTSGSMYLKFDALFLGQYYSE
ncbi:MAG: hypothetical protein RL660_134 [Bacteroidota bacterium]|jgi:hypothetical protein